MQTIKAQEHLEFTDAVKIQNQSKSTQQYLRYDEGTQLPADIHTNGYILKPLDIVKFEPDDASQKFYIYNPNSSSVDIHP